MIRVLNFFCVAVIGLAVMAENHISEKTRVTEMQLERATRQISDARTAIGVLETEWERVAGPARIQELAESRLGMSDATSVQLSSFDLLPRRGDDAAPLNNTPVRNASAEAQQAPLPVQQISDRSGL